MIPVTKNNYEIIYFTDEKFSYSLEKYRELLKDQLGWLNEHYVQVINKSNKLYNLYFNNRLSNNMVDRCCNFKLLEEKCLEYNIIMNEEKINV